MVNKVKKVSMGSSPSYSYQFGEEARARFKHLSLKQDFHELMKEVEGQKKRLRRSNHKKVDLSIVVKFLRKKVKCFLENPSLETLYRLKNQSHESPQTSYRLKKQSHEIPSKPICVVQPHNPGIEDEGPIGYINHGEKEAAIPRIPILDLNQISFPIGEQMELEPLRLEKFSRRMMDGDTAANDLKLPVWRDVGNGLNQVGKRKVSWGDSVIVEV